MAWRRKQEKAGGGEIVVQDDGVLVLGSSHEIEAIVGELTRRVSAGGGVVQASVAGADVLAVAGSAWAIAASHGTYLKLSKRAAALLAEHGPEPSTFGTTWGFVRDKASGQIRGILDGTVVDMNPMQLVSMQQALTTMALRAAIHKVAEGVARVEAHVEHIQRLLESQRVGDALGAFRALEGLTRQLEASGTVATTDWHAIAGVFVQTMQSIEMLRANIRRELDARTPGRRTRNRADDLEELADEDLQGMLALLVVHQHNLLAWHQLRIARMRSAEPDQLPFAIDEARSQLLEQRTADEALLADLTAALERFVSPTGLEGFAPRARGRLRDAGDDLAGMIAWFAERRTLDVDVPELQPLPTAADTVRGAAELVRDLGHELTSRVAGAARRRQAERVPPTAELPSGDRPPAELPEAGS